MRSLRAVYAGAVALFVHDDPALLAFLAAHDVEAVVVPTPDAWTPQPVVAQGRSRVRAWQCRHCGGAVSAARRRRRAQPEAPGKPGDLCSPGKA